MSENYQPNSSDALLSRILLRLDLQDRESQLSRTEMKGLLTDIHTQMKADFRVMDQRLSAVENWQTSTKAKAAVILGVATVGGTSLAWILEKIFHL